jgi:hypothetical protein
VRPGGHARNRIARTLSSAYAAGLLSEDTYLHRVDHLLGAQVIEPDRLAGDLNFRRDRWGWRAPPLERLRRGRGDPPPGEDPVLALDWNGSTTRLLVGRSGCCDVVFPGPEVSRRHALLRFRDGRWIIQDLESTNGTFVNHVRVGRCELRPGDRLLLGGGRAVVVD